MKKIYILLTVLLLTSSLGYTQTGVFSLGANLGLYVPMGDDADAFKLSPSIGAEVGYSINPQFDLVANFSHIFLSLKGTSSSSVSYSYTEFTAGGRFNFVTEQQGKIFGEACLGSYTAGLSATSGGTTASVTNTEFGINAGFGGIYSINKNFDLIGKLKLHDIFTSNSSTNYLTFTAGVNYLFR